MISGRFIPHMAVPCRLLSWQGDVLPLYYARILTPTVERQHFTTCHEICKQKERIFETTFFLLESNIAAMKQPKGQTFLAPDG
jgi:hypothetical protein